MSEQQESQPPAGKPSYDRFVKIGFLVVLLGIMTFLYFRHRGPPKLLGWGTDLTEALTAARSKDVRVLVMFTQLPMSHWDKKMTEENVKRGRIVKILEELKYVRVHLNTKDHGALAEKYKVTQTPAFLILDSTGKELHRQVGFSSEGVFRDFLYMRKRDAGS